MSEEEFKADHFKNIEELLEHCDLWIKTEDYDAYCRFFDMGAMEEIYNYTKILQQENEDLRVTIKNDDIVVNKLCEENAQLKQQLEQLEEKYINNVPCCNENDCDMFKDYMLLKQQLKDKDEKISKVIEYIKENVKAELLNGSIWIDKYKLIEILES